MPRHDDLVQERIERLLPSQKYWMTAPETERVLMGGWRAGKTRIGCLTTLLCSYLIPNNLWFIGRASGKDLHSTTIQTFFDEVCPSEMIVGKPKKIGQQGLEVVLRTKYEGHTSKVYFDYIMDKQTNRSHLAGGNWGGFLVDQVEEINRAAWHKLLGRLSRTYFHPEKKKVLAVKTHALGVGNQMGHDQFFEDFFQGGDYKFDLLREPKVFYKAIHRGHRLGVIVRSEENRMSNGGFVPDEYFDQLRKSMPPEWVARYLDGSFDDFSGKIYSDYNIDSVHNIEPFPIPSHWPWYCSIDPGGSSPWGIGVYRIDEEGNKIKTDDAAEIYKQLNLNPNKAIRWIKDHLPVDETRFLIDYQNKAVMIQLQDEGIHCEPASKDVFAGLMRAKSEFFVNPERLLPVWYERTQPRARYERFKDKGAPSFYVFNTCKGSAKEYDNYMWDPARPNEPKNNQSDHYCDETRYFMVSSPQPAIPAVEDPFLVFRRSDPTSAEHADKVARELQRLRNKEHYDEVRAMDPMDGGTSSYEEREFIRDYC